MASLPLTPRAAGFRMPPEWAPHSATIMLWPSRRSLWEDRYDTARDEYAKVAAAIAAFEPVFMVCEPDAVADVRRRCPSTVTPLPFGADDSWARDCGPTFVTDDAGELAVVKFGFNAWGNRFHPYDQDALVPERIAAHFGVPLFSAPMVLEGGSFFVDGEGTMITTEQCLRNPNRNRHLGTEDIERMVGDYLGIDRVIWLPYGHSLDTGPTGTDGHIDGVAQYVAPGRVLLEVPESEDSTEFARARANLAALRGALDARGRSIEVERFDPPLDAEVSYANHYLVNGAVIVPVDGGDGVERSLGRLREIYPGREVVGVRADTIATGGGGPHCITQQIPAGLAL
ncbi:agmatine/peptidylarginine deiminase [uncultured Microbacterium sp.]|uniref:agmatine deiminase family protein n=1 Tax=uncultured Microbacterium sp. TaxID=191216 RepID=UPI0025E5DA0B|nr:agmatine deiminase family protein [uncultured Microbacterium sp.]